MIYEKHPVPVERTVCVCDCCGRWIVDKEDIVDWQERFAVRFRGGAGSEFGAGSAVAGDFCQDCIRKLLGKYFRIEVDWPFAPAHEIEGKPRRIYQPNQMESPGQSGTENGQRPPA